MKKKLISNLFLFLLLFALFAGAGCVRRTVTITSVPQGASVYFDNKYAGETPVELDFNFYGGHRLELAKTGYENQRTTLKLKAPLYEYIPADFIVECLLPVRLHDAHRAEYVLKEGTSRPPAVYQKAEPKEDKEKEDKKNEEEKRKEEDKLFE